MSDNGNSAETAVEIVDEGPCRKRIRTQIPATLVDTEVGKSYQQIGKNVQIPGFRKGRVPRSVLERKFGEQVVNDVRDDMMHRTFEEELEKQELRMIGSPNFDKVEFTIGEPFVYEAVFDIVPSFELPKYKGLEVEAEPTAVDDSDVDEEIEQLRERSAEMVDSDGPVREEFAEASVVLTPAEGEPINQDGVLLKIGDDSVDNITVDGLSDALLGASSGDELSFDIEMPADFPVADLQGAKATLKVDVTGFKRREMPELDDEFAGRFKMETLDGLRSEVRKGIENRRRTHEENRQEELLVERVVDATDMELPESILDSRKRELAQDLRSRLGREGKSEEEIDSIIEADASLKEEASRDLKKIFVLEKIADKEVILVTEDEILRRMAEIAAAMGRDLGEIVEEYRSRNMLPELRAGMIREKVRATLRKKAKITGEDKLAIAEKVDTAEKSGGENGADKPQTEGDE